MRPKVVVILGPTATGKSTLALELARSFRGEIISADSMQVYRLMDIGTAKPPPEVRREVPHHLIDVVWPDEDFSAGLFRRYAEEAISEIVARGKVPIVAGGTGLYIKALTEGLVEGVEGNPEVRRRLKEEAERVGPRGLWERLREVDPQSAARVHPHDLYRILRALEIYHCAGTPASALRERHRFSERPYETLKIGLWRPREALYRRIDQRVEEMIKGGLRDEVKGLLERGYSPELKSMRSIGYREMVEHLQGAYPLEEASRKMKRDTRRFAKRQMTWFKRDPEIHWLSYPEERDRIMGLVADFLTRAPTEQEGADGGKTEETH